MHQHIVYYISCLRDTSTRYARVAQLVERDLAKVEAAGSSPVSRFYFLKLEDSSFFFYSRKQILIHSLLFYALNVSIFLNLYFLFPEIVCSTMLFIVSSFSWPLAYPNTSPSFVIIKVVGNALIPYCIKTSPVVSISTG